MDIDHKWIMTPLAVQKGEVIVLLFRSGVKPIFGTNTPFCASIKTRLVALRLPSLGVGCDTDALHTPEVLFGKHNIYIHHWFSAWVPAMRYM